jgi:heme oxygenase
MKDAVDDLLPDRSSFFQIVRPVRGRAAEMDTSIAMTDVGPDGGMVELSPSNVDFSLVAAMRHATQALHTQAERSGFVQEVLRGRAEPGRYVLFLRNLLPVYRELEAGLQRHRDSPGARRILRPELFRTAAIERDLVAIGGPGWETVTVLPAGEAYRRQVSAAADGDGARLIGHAYTRYLGDLSGAQVLRRLLARDLHLGPESLSLYDFPAIPDHNEFKSVYRLALDEAGRECADAGAVVHEAVAAFALNIRLSEAVQGVAG